MNVSEALKMRRSCRAFRPDPVDKDALLAILDDALRAPSWGNTQPWEIFAAGGETLREIREAYLENARNHVPTSFDIPHPRRWPPAAGERTKELSSGVSLLADGASKLFGELNQELFHAPAVIFLCMDKDLTAWSLFDLGALSQSIMLAATERGLATIPAVQLVRYPEILRGKLDIPDSLSVVIGIAIGYEDTRNPINQLRSTRRPVSDVVRIKGIE